MVPKQTGPFVVTGGTLHDGRSLRGSVDVVVEGDRIAGLLPRGTSDLPAELDATGCWVVPGLIDPHSMARGVENVQARSADNLLFQGVTSTLIGNCGMSGVFPEEAAGSRLASQLGSADLDINVGFLLGHNSALALALSFDDPDASVLRQVKTALDAGALGVSMGLMYSPGSEAEATSLDSVAQVVGQSGGVLAVHVRDEAAGIISSMNELARFATCCRVSHLHLKVCGPQHWALADQAIELASRYYSTERYRFTVYPYSATNTALGALPPPSVRGGELSTADALRAIEEFGLQNLSGGGFDGVRVTSAGRYQGMTIGAIARLSAEPPAASVLRLLREDPAVRVLFEDVAELESLWRTLDTPGSSIGSDGYLYPAGSSECEHPRSFGSFASAIHRVASDHEALSTLIRKCTSEMASWYNIPDRGLIEVGRYADIAVLDMTEVGSRATYEMPSVLASGLRHLVVNGALVIVDGARVEGYRGRPILRKVL